MAGDKDKEKDHKKNSAAWHGAFQSMLKSSYNDLVSGHIRWVKRFIESANDENVLLFNPDGWLVRKFFNFNKS